MRIKQYLYVGVGICIGIGVACETKELKVRLWVNSIVSDFTSAVGPVLFLLFKWWLSTSRAYTCYPSLLLLFSFFTHFRRLALPLWGNEQRQEESLNPQKPTELLFIVPTKDFERDKGFNCSYCLHPIFCVIEILSS